VTDSTVSLLSPPSLQQAGKHNYWQIMSGSAASLAVSNLAKQSQAPVVFVCSETQHMHRISRELDFFASESFNELHNPLLHFSDWECLPYDKFSPHQDIVSERLLSLYTLPTLQQGVVLTSSSALSHRLSPKDYVVKNAINMSVGGELNTQEFTQQLIDAGYYSVSQVMSPGEYAVRGGIIDVFPSGTKQPFRIDLFDTEIENIKLFDPETQRSTDSVDQIRLLPAKEFPLDQAGIDCFRSQFRKTFEGDPQSTVIYPEVSKGIAPAGSEYYLPLFFNETATLFDYLPENTIFVFEDGAYEKLEEFYTDAKERYENLRHDIQWPILSPESLFIQPDEIRSKLKDYQLVDLMELNLNNKSNVQQFACSALSQFNLQAKSESPYQPFIDYLNGVNATSQQKRIEHILISVESAGRRETMLDILKKHNLQPKVFTNWSDFINQPSSLGVIVSELDKGLKLPSAGIEVISESQLYGDRVYQRRRRSNKNKDPDAIIRSLAELNLGDAIVHEDHGVGRYLGLESHRVGEVENELLVIEYSGGDKLFIPVLSLEKISRYVGGTPESAPLHKLGTEAWSKARQKAQEKAYDVAAELLEVQAMRMARKGYAFAAPDEAYSAFSAGFKFEETPDQQNVIDDVITDMTNATPMDRLVCGDVGFGKTEIAMRACYMAIASNKQVAILVPTTLLAQQHYQNFCDRFADWPVRVELISRFKTKKETEQVLKELDSGQVDIVVGTHRLIQNDIEFKRLGLVIIDEEHRFGVRQKEQLKQLRSQVDILTLTATPIPRTLNMALSGMRDISVIATPPKSRLAVKTFVREWDNATIKEACLREIHRGGQIYFLHNEVRTINKVKEQLQELLPDVNIGIGHGQMSERELESVMRDFYHQRFHILLCTTIIESGIDIPSANTIIINRADRFGLAQLHQMRGRVGRSHHQAYAYMITPERAAMTDDAYKRLTAIESLDELGAGFALASQDLEIRGAGELLGESQSGSMDQVGYSLFNDFLEQAIKSLKQDQARNDSQGSTPIDTPLSATIHTIHTEINLHTPARFPDDYIPDVSLRLSLYKRISSADNEETINEIQVECVDRFGLQPDAVKNLFNIAKLKLQLGKLSIKKVEVGPAGGKFELSENPNINIGRLMELMSQHPQDYQMKGADTFVIKRDMLEVEQRFSLLQEVIEELK
jgi:transcription-repair coupling factor (superfamily II helicase)